MKKNKGKAYVYLVGNWDTPNIYKIGVTRGDIKKRIKQLQTGNPSDLCISKYYETEYPFFLEKQLHFRFRDKHIDGEWYELQLFDMINFENACKQIEEMIEGLKDNEFFMKNLK